MTNGGAAFPFGLSFGFQGFNRPATFRQFNRALAARVRLYQGDRAASLSAIASSFFNINGDLQSGPRYGFGPADRNPLFHAPDVDLYTVHPNLQRGFADPRVRSRIRLYDAERVARLPVSHDDLSGDHQLALVAFDTDPCPIMRNEELVLIYAETQVGLDANEVLAAVNRVRGAAGLGNYLGPTDNLSLMTEILGQRQRSFFGEGHRWIDMRRTNRLADLPLDRPGDGVHVFLPRPGPAVIQDL